MPVSSEICIGNNFKKALLAWQHAEVQTAIQDPADRIRATGKSAGTLATHLEDVIVSSVWASISLQPAATLESSLEELRVWQHGSVKTNGLLEDDGRIARYAQTIFLESAM